MKLRSISKIRNHVLIAERERRGINQAEMASLLDIPMFLYCRLEKLDFPKKFDEDLILKIACKLKIQPDDIMPRELAGVSVINKTEKVAEVSVKNILDCGCIKANFILDSPSDIAAKDDDTLELLKHVDELSYREKEVIKMRFGVGEDCTEYTYSEIARIFKVTRERVRQVERKAIRKLKNAYQDNVDEWKFSKVPENEHASLCDIAMG